MNRDILTPGKLYALLAAEFRRLRPEHCGNCRMPMVVLTHRLGPAEANWTVEDSSPLCEKCAPLIAAIVKQAAARYDINDPVSVPFFPLPPSHGPGLGIRH